MLQSVRMCDILMYQRGTQRSGKSQVKKVSIKEGQSDKSKITSRLYGQSWLNIEDEGYTELTDRMSETPTPINKEVHKERSVKYGRNY